MIARYASYPPRAAAIFVLMAVATWIVPALADEQASQRPAVGDKAPEIRLANLEGETVKSSTLTKQGSVVLLVLRGYPGDQCPICSRQVGQFIGAAKKLRDAGASVVLVYPGAAERLPERAKEFVSDRTLPAGFHFLIDPDYTFVNAWELRWDAPRETAYPATYVIGADGIILFSKVSASHAGRVSVDEVMEALTRKVGERPKLSEDPATAARILDRVRAHAFQPIRDGFTKDAGLDRSGIADLANNDWRVRTLAIRDLVLIGAPALPTLRNGLRDENLHVRNLSALLLGILPVEGEYADTLEGRLEALRSTLRNDADSAVRSEAAIALGRLGKHGARLVLEAAVREDSSRDVRHQSEIALARIDAEPFDDSLFKAYLALDESKFNIVSVGQPAPDFTLHDTDGLAWRLSDFRGDKHVVLIWIFADWCPVCHGEFRDLIEMKHAFIERDVTVATIECHEAYRTRVMVGRERSPEYWFAKQAPQARYLDGIWWSHLSDPAGAVGAEYGVAPLAFAVHAEYINRPGTIIIDKEGIVRFAYYGTFWEDRPNIQETLEMIRSGEFSFEHPKRLK